MVINLALYLYFVALSFFLSAQFLIGVALPIIAGQLFKIGAWLILCAFALLFISGLFLFAKIATTSILNYFSHIHRVKRNYLCIQNRHDQIDRLFHFKMQKVRHCHELTVKRLIIADDRKHLHDLFSAIHGDLRAMKKNLPSKTYQRMLWECLYFRMQKDDQSLLKLQQKITELI